MDQNIRYKGLALTPDELAAESGTLAISANAEIHDGAIRPSMVVGTEVENALTYTPSGSQTSKVVKLVFVHKTPTYTHYIALDQETPANLHWYLEDGSPGDIISDFDYTVVNDDGSETANAASIIQVEAIGNTIIVLATNGKHYILWKQDENNGTGNYKYLGQQPPFVKLSFSTTKLQSGNYGEGESTTFYIAKNVDVDYTRSGGVFFFDNEAASEVTTNVWALINKANQMVTDEGHFHDNFMVRYCYRLYDGTMYYHSAPVFIPVCLPEPIAVACAPNDGGIRMVYYPMNVSLSYKLENSQTWTQLSSEWKDIVSSVDIFVSPPLMKNSDSEKITHTEERGYDYGVYNLWDRDNQRNENGIEIRHETVGAQYFVIPGISNEEYNKKIRENTTFYKVRSFTLGSTMSTGGRYLKVIEDNGVLKTLTSQEAMTDDYKSHNNMLPTIDSEGNVISHMYTYNQRLNISAVKERLFEGFDISGGLMPECIDYRINNDGNVTVTSVYVELSTENGNRLVRHPISGGQNVTLSEWALCYCLFFYPDSRARRMYVNYTRDNVAKYATIELEPCLYLNGAMAVHNSAWGNNEFPGTSGTFSGTVSCIDERPNVIYTSDASNPFRFPPNSINTVGTGTILGMAANTRALSQGQFGQFPLLAFATDGVWALNVTSKGTYDSIHPISREVCSNPDSICQIDQEVVFATVRGLNAVTEQNVTPISEELDGPFLPDNIITPGLQDYVYENHYEDIAHQMIWDASPIDFFQTANVMYDFAGNRLLVIGDASPGDQQQNIMVYSLRDRTWGTMVIQPMIAAVNGYPHMYIQDTSGHVMALDKRYPYEETDAGTVNVMAVTRALSFGDAMYTINDIIQNHTAANKPMLFMWGSNDLKTWHYIGRTNQEHVYYLPGRAWRYYRLGVLAKMEPGEQYISTSFNVKEKFGKL